MEGEGFDDMEPEELDALIALHAEEEEEEEACSDEEDEVSRCLLTHGQVPG